MIGKTFSKVLSSILIFLMIISGFSNIPIQNSFPTQNALANPQRIDLGNGTWVEITVNGNITTLMFSDTSMIIVNASSDVTTIEFYESIESINFTRLSIIANESFSSTVYPFDNVQIPTTTGFKIDLVQRLTSEIILGSWEFLSYSSFDSSHFSMFEMQSQQMINSTANRMFNAIIAANQTKFGASFTSYVSSTGDMVSLDLNGDTSSPANSTFLLRNEGGGYSANYSIDSGQDPQNSVDSFFDVFASYMDQTGNGNQYEMSGKILDFLSSFDFRNVTSGFQDSLLLEQGMPPQTVRYPSNGAVDNPNDPFDIIDVIIMSEMITFVFGGLSVVLFPDKLVVDYYTFDGLYVPIVVFFETLEIHVIIMEITIIVYMQSIELLMVIIIQEIIKIEVYIQYIVLVVEILEITIIEITLTFIDIDITIIEISITVNIWIFKIIIKVVKKVIIFLPFWILIIPIFIPVPVPFFVPVPTPVPVPVPQTIVNLYNQTLDERNDVMNLTYYVSDEYGNPISGANLTLTMNTRPGIIYNGSEIIRKPGYYEFTNLPLDLNVEITVTADTNSYRPLGFITHVITINDVTDTVIVPSNVTVTNTATYVQYSNVTTTVPNGTITQTIVQNNTVTSTVNNNSTASTTPINLPLMIITTIALSQLMVIIRKRRKQKI